MRSRLIIFLSALALMVLVFVQYFFITQTYETKRAIVDARYEGTIRSALAAFHSRDVSYTFDSILFELDNLAIEYLFADPDTLRESPIPVFQQHLQDYRESEEFVRKAVAHAGLDTKFTFHLLVRDLKLKDLGVEVRVPVDSSLMVPPSEDALLVGRHTYGRNFFEITYDNYIDLYNHTRIVLDEMWLILALTFFMLALVFSVFVMTLRNMFRQKRLSEMKTDFINNMTHELKTPLSTISVASSSLGNRDLIRNEDKVAEISGLIKKQNRHLTDLIDRILDINIWERDQVRLQISSTPVQSWLQDLAGAFRIKHPDVSLQINIHHDSELQAELDEVHLSTAINNLLGNAVKYGNTPCAIRMDSQVAGGQLEICVKDNGPGISREDLRHIFEKFYRGHESKYRVIRGLGLGLYYVKQIVEAHGGHVSVVSEAGKGSAFTLKIPLKNGHITG